MPRTRLSVCRRKVRHATRAAAIAAAMAGGWLARPYACDRCGQFHLTSRRRGGWIPRAIREAARDRTDGGRAAPSAPGADDLC